MTGAHDAIPIYLYLLTPATYLIIPSGPLGAISDLHTERQRWIYRSAVCDVDITREWLGGGLSEPSRTEQSRPRGLREAARRLRSTFCSYFRKSARTNSGIAMRRIFLSFLLFALLARRAFTEIVALCTPRGTRAREAGARNACRHVARARDLSPLFFFLSSILLPLRGPRFARARASPEGLIRAD